jgi:hypothetical protein
MRTVLKCFFVFAVLGILESAYAGPVVIGFANFSGSQEVPPNASTAVGSITVTLNGDILGVSLNFSGLIGGSATAAHIHCSSAFGVNAGVALPFTGFPSVTSGTYSNTFDLTQTSVYNPTFLAAKGGTAAGAEAALITGIESANAYGNIHNPTFPGGEIEAFFVPEPSSVTLAALGLGALLYRRFRRL